MKLLYNANIELEHSILDYVTKEDDRERMMQNLSRALNGEHLVEESFTGELQLTRTYSELRHKPIYDDNQRIIGVSVMNKDITKRRRADDKLHGAISASARFFTALIPHLLVILLSSQSEPFAIAGVNIQRHRNLKRSYLIRILHQLIGA